MLFTLCSVYDEISLVIFSYIVFNRVIRTEIVSNIQDVIISICTGIVNHFNCSYIIFFSI